MMNLNQITDFFPIYMKEKPGMIKYMYKEYIQVLILDFISSSKWAKRLDFIGGTNLRLIKAIDRFSEDLDFDCKNFTQEDFWEFSADVINYLNKTGFTTEAKEKESSRINAYRKSIYFPELLFNLGLSKHKDERFLIKLECQDQGYLYKPQTAKVKGFGFYFNVRQPGDDVLCAMKINALINRKKGRDFYDVMFLLSRTMPDFGYLEYKLGIKDLKTLKEELIKVFDSVKIENKMKDFEHLVFDIKNCKRIQDFKSFVVCL